MGRGEQHVPHDMDAATARALYETRPEPETPLSYAIKLLQRVVRAGYVEPPLRAEIREYLDSVENEDFDLMQEGRSAP